MSKIYGWDRLIYSSLWLFVYANNKILQEKLLFFGDEFIAHLYYWLLNNLYESELNQFV